MMKVAVCICTYRRPEMLKACLGSIARQAVPAGWDVVVVVVDNDAHSASPLDLTPALEGYPFPLEYRQESARGIPFARNTACELALASGAGWVIFIDDDEEAEAGWLVAYAEALAKYDAKVFSGPVRYILPEGPRDLGAGGKRFLVDGCSLDKVATNNVMFSTSLLNPPLSMRFDIGMALTGGSDGEFFGRYRRTGQKMLAVAGAVVSEVVLENRRTLLWKLRRDYRLSANDSYVWIKHLGKRTAFLKVLLSVLVGLPRGGLRLLSAPLLLFAGKERVVRAMYRGIRYWVKCAGAIAGFFGIRPQPYRYTDGY